MSGGALLPRRSTTLPAFIDGDMPWKRAISRAGILLLAALLIGISGVGVNMTSHALIDHLAQGERRFEEDSPARREGDGL